MKKLKIAILFLVSIIAFQLFACDTPTPNEEHIIDGPHMSERVYARVNEEDFTALCEEINTLLESKGNKTLIEEKREFLFSEFYNKALTMSTTASINYDKDVTDKYWQEESVQAETIAQNIHNETLKIEKNILSSKYYSRYFKKLLGKEYAEQILETDVETPEQLEMQERISALEAEYSSVYASGKLGTVADIYIELVNTRNEYAKTVKDDNGQPYKNYMDYAYAEIYGRDYTPQNANSFRNAVKKYFRPVKDFMQANSATLNKDQYITDVSVYEEYLPYIIENTAPSMLDSWNYMLERELYDFSFSYNKAQTSYVTSYTEFNDAFMFVNVKKSFNSDISTLVHEFGHYNEVFMADPNLAKGAMNYDLAETHSQTFELLTLPAVKSIITTNYPNTKKLFESYTYNILFQGVWSILINCAFDEFEYNVYTTNEELSAPYLNDVFKNAWSKYWGGTQSYYYHDIPHLFQSPAYCISYSVSMVFSHEINFSEKPIENYLAVVKMGTDNTLSNVCSTVGLSNPLDPANVEDCATKLRAYVKNTFYW